MPAPVKIAQQNVLLMNPGDETLYPLRTFARMLDLSYTSMVKYTSRGVHDVNGRLVKLEVCILPCGSRATSREAYQRFLRRINARLPQRPA